ASLQPAAAEQSCLPDRSGASPGACQGSCPPSCLPHQGSWPLSRRRLCRALRRESGPLPPRLLRPDQTAAWLPSQPLRASVPSHPAGRLRHILRELSLPDTRGFSFLSCFLNSLVTPERRRELVIL